jgi:sterol desaturase/sphingolipid hydroxylase (fatty acid hydroxylase superfamily)
MTTLTADDTLTGRVVGGLTLPVLLTAALVGTVVLVERDASPAVAAGIVIALSYLVIALLERVVPYERDWVHSKGDLGIDAAWFATNGVLNRLLEPPVLAVSVAASAWLATRIGAPAWPQTWSLLAQILLALVVAEWFEYWAHRWMHESEWLWRFHALHHSAPRLYWLNAVRFHPVDTLILGIGKLLPLALLGAPALVLALVNVFSAVHGSLKHANVPARIGPLNWVFSMAELHRWHHSPMVAEANHNYGGNLILWDVVFGTRYLPHDRKPPSDVGLVEAAEYPRYPMDYVGQLLAPLRWKKRQSPFSQD